MADPYWRYGASADTASISRPALPGYLTSEAPTLTSRPLWASHDLLSNSSDFLQKDNLVSLPGAYGSDDIMGIGVRHESGFSGYTAGASLNGYSSALGDPYLLGRRDVTPGNGPGIPDIVNERPDSLKMVDGFPVGSRESNVLFVDGLPNNCSRREVSHLFRPFFGLREIRVVHKEPRHRGDKAMVLCFVEFIDAKCALTALEALQGYKFDIKKLDSPALKIHFAHFPFRLPSDGNEQHLAVPRPQTFEEAVDPTIDAEKDGYTPNTNKKFEKRKFGGKKFEGQSLGSRLKKSRFAEKKKESFEVCAMCGKQHSGECLAGSNACFKCGRLGHMAYNCEEKKACYICGSIDHIQVNCPRRVNKERLKITDGPGEGKAESSKAKGWVFQITVEEAKERLDVVTGNAE